MAKRSFLMMVMGLVSIGAQAERPTPKVALKLDVEMDHVAPLPLNAKEAAQRFGVLDPDQLTSIKAVNEQLFRSVDDPSVAGWKGPALMLSHSTQNQIETTDLAGFRKELGVGPKTLFDPYSLGKRGDLTYAVIMVRLLRGPVENWVAVAFVLKGTMIQRIVIAPQPWITLMSSSR